MTGEITKLEITEEDARLFIAFQANYESFKKLCASRVFDIKNGKAILNFDNTGELQTIELQYYTYKQGKNA